MKTALLSSRSLSAACGLLLTPSLLCGQVLFDDNFEAHDVDGRPGSPWTRAVDIEDAGTGTILVIEDSANRFGAGPANQILEMRKDTTGAGMALQASAGIFSEDASEITTFSFELYQPSDPGFSVNATMDLWVYAGGIGGANAVGRARFGLASGQVALDPDGSYPLDRANYFDFIINSGTAPFDYTIDEQDFTIDSASFDVWLEGDFLGSWALENHKITGAVESFQLNVASGGRIHQYFDEFVVREEAFVIPEPGTVGALSGLFAMGAVLLLRRRRVRRC